MKTEKFDATSAIWEIEGIKSGLVCKILNYDMDRIAVNDFRSIAQIDEKELNRLRDSINDMLSEVEKQPIEKASEESSQKIETLSRDDIINIVDDCAEGLVKHMIFLIQAGEQEKVINMLANNCRKANDEQERGQQLEVVREEINRVFDRVFELRMKGFLRLEEMISEIARPVENWKPIPELKEKTTEAIKLIRDGHLEQEKLKDYMDSEISKIYLCRAMREYEKLWESAKYASSDETIELICQAIKRMENKMKEVNKMIKDSLSEAGVQDASEGSEIFKDLIEVFAKQDILYHGSADYYNRLLEISKNFKP